jgi:hypothetical protein
MHVTLLKFCPSKRHARLKQYIKWGETNNLRCKSKFKKMHIFCENDIFWQSGFIAKMEKGFLESPFLGFKSTK